MANLEMVLQLLETHLPKHRILEPPHTHERLHFLNVISMATGF